MIKRLVRPEIFFLANNLKTGLKLILYITVKILQSCNHLNQYTAADKVSESCGLVSDSSIPFYPQFVTYIGHYIRLTLTSQVTLPGGNVYRLV